jgi:hypothetical protein
MSWHASKSRDMISSRPHDPSPLARVFNGPSKGLYEIFCWALEYLNSRWGKLGNGAVQASSSPSNHMCPVGQSAGKPKNPPSQPDQPSIIHFSSHDLLSLLIPFANKFCFVLISSEVFANRSVSHSRKKWPEAPQSLLSLALSRSFLSPRLGFEVSHLTAFTQLLEDMLTSNQRNAVPARGPVGLGQRGRGSRSHNAHTATHHYSIQTLSGF